ncbi:hypothetical protein RHSIM_Rhsim05G0202700 [Rhododendron simsii]|uniref:Legume lectin domain-containing protein n=1 Tax=Rhododendron simsii TaxID=118357 RepID=A0A834LNL2_RHOSS|nr:hypothetical protein RHSIM_Rhsim05G0202700 [Rhododendron simsii]
MATLSPLRYILALSVLVLLFKTISGFSNSTFSFKNFGNGSNYESKLALYGDAKVVNGGSSVQITGFSSLRAGRIFYKKPIRLVGGNPMKFMSVSTRFTFSISPGNGDGLAFVVVPVGFPLAVFDGGSFGLLSGYKNRTFSVEFETLMDVKNGDLNGTHVGVDDSGLLSVKVGNVSSPDLVLNSGKKLQAWVDYEAGSKRLEVRLSEFGKMRPVDPLLSYPIDLSQMWKEREVFIGLSSSNGNSTQSCNLYSWSFKLRHVPQWMHSEPLDPKGLSNKPEYLSVPKKSDCFWRIIAALIFGTGCGALGVFFALFLCTIFGKRPPVVPEEYPPPSLGFVEYEKFKVVLDKAVDDGGNKLGV